MPIEFTPPRRLLNAVLRLRERMHGKDGGPDMRPKLTSEPVESVNQDGTYQVRGTTLSATGLKQLEPGEVVVVAWKQGKPDAIVAHQVQRAQFPQIAVPGGPLVEELFIANTTTGTRDVFFRNAAETVALQLGRFVVASSINSVKWGSTNEWFFCNVGTNLYAVFHLNRTPNKGIGAGALDLVSLDRVENLATKTLPLAQLSFDGVGNPATIIVTPQGGTGYTISVSSLCLDTAGALIVTYFLSVADNIGSDNLPSTPNPNFRSSIISFAGQPGINGGALYPIVADVTNNVVLLNTFTNLTLFSSLLWPSFDYNGTPRVTVTYFDGSVIHAVIRPTTWVQANTVLFGTLNVTWWVGYSQTPSAFTIRLEPIFVLDKTVVAGERVRGFVAYFRGDYTVAVGQTSDDPTDFAFHAPGTPAQQIIFPTPPFDVTASVAASVRTPYFPVSLFPLAAYPTRPVAGLSFAPTLNHLVWRLTPTATFFTTDNGLNVGGADSPGFATEFAKGVAVQITPTLRASIGQHGIVFARTDFAYQLDNPVTPLPANAAKPNYFVNAWAFAGAVTLNSAAAGFPPELAALAPSKALADIPAGVVQPTGPDQFSLYVNNDKDVLSPLSLFEDFPVPPPA